MAIAQDPHLATTTAEGDQRTSPARKFETLTLKTGESLRRFPQWPPAYSQWEKDHTMTFELQPPREEDGPIRFVHREKEEYEANLRPGPDVNYLNVLLSQKVNNAVFGPQQQDVRKDPLI